jgi:hypothetical protein
MSDEAPLYEKIISENTEKGKQLRLVVNEFRGIQYLHLRYYFLSYEGDWLPTKEGASMPATIQSIYSLLDGLIEICAAEENIDAVNKHFNERLNEQNLRISSISESELLCR